MVIHGDEHYRVENAYHNERDVKDWWRKGGRDRKKSSRTTAQYSGSMSPMRRVPVGGKCGGVCPVQVSQLRSEALVFLLCFLGVVMADVLSTRYSWCRPKVGKTSETRAGVIIYC